MNLALQRGNLQEAHEYLRRVEGVVDASHVDDAQAQAALLLDQAAYYIGIGDNKKARNLLAIYTKDYKDDVVGWSMLAMLNIDEGRVEEVKGYIAANIRRAKNTSPYYTHILDGRLAQVEAEQLVKHSPGVQPHENQPIRRKYEEARAYYRSAYASRPNAANVIQMILQIDFILHDGIEAVRDAETLLQCDPENPMALYAIGMKRLEDAILFGDIGAEGYFSRAVEHATLRRMQMPLELLINTADVLARTDNPAKLAQADVLAAEATRRVAGTENEFIATATHAHVLAHMGKVNEAKQMMTYTRSLPGLPDIPQMAFVDIWIAIKEGRKTEARQRLDAVRQTIGTAATKLDRLDFELMENALK
jgi:tetratricopeptide (TPR) repeat protein